MQHNIPENVQSMLMNLYKTIFTESENFAKEQIDKYRKETEDIQIENDELYEENQDLHVQLIELKKKYKKQHHKNKKLKETNRHLLYALSVKPYVPMPGFKEEPVNHSVSDEVEPLVVKKQVVEEVDEQPIEQPVVEVEEPVVDEEPVVEVEQQEEDEQQQPVVEVEQPVIKESEEQEEEDEEEEELEEVVINGKRYYASNKTNGIIYGIDENDDPADEVGKYVNGQPIFTQQEAPAAAAEEEDEEEESVEEVEINGTRYYVTDQKNGKIYAVEEDDDVGDEVGYYMNGIAKFYKK
jgi:hypothetical protein